MEPAASKSQDTLDETFESVVQEESPMKETVQTVETVETPPSQVSTPKLERIKQKYGVFTSPIKMPKGLRLGSIKKAKVKREEESDLKMSKNDEDGAEAEAEDVESDGVDKHKKKKSGVRHRANVLWGALGGRRREKRVADRLVSSGSSNVTTPDSTIRPPHLAADGRSSNPSFNDESGSQFGSVEDVDMQSPLAEVDKAASSDTECATEPPTSVTDPAEDILTIATNHPVSTKPFAVSTWKPKSSKSLEIEKPIESPSPEDCYRRRISFVKQATYCLSEDKDLQDIESPVEDFDTPVIRLSRMVELARQQNRLQDPPTRSNSCSPSFNTTPQQQDEKTDDEEYEDTEGVNPAPVPADMPPYGDLLIPEKKPAMGTGTSVSHPPGNIGENRREFLYKILVIGELGTGKTSIIKRYVHQFFSQHYRATIGVDFALKVLNWDPNTTIRLQLWDIAGQERFGNMTRVYYKEAVGAFIVFDVSRVSTFEAVVKWKQDLDSKVQLPNGANIPCVLLGNKCDQQKEGLVNNQTKMEEFCKEKGFDNWFETSAKENINIEEAARALVTKILSNETNGQSVQRENDRILLDQGRDAGRDANKKKCIC